MLYREEDVLGETHPWQNGKKLPWSQHAFAEYVIGILPVYHEVPNSQS